MVHVIELTRYKRRWYRDYSPFTDVKGVFYFMIILGGNYEQTVRKDIQSERD